MMPRKHVRALAPAVVVAFAVVAAGCLGETGNAPPEAVLATEEPSTFAGDPLMFDARGSTDPDGNLTLLRLDLGDGTVKEFEDADEAIVNHTYAKPGNYTVRLTVLDDGAEDEPLADTAETEVFVNERIPVSAQVASLAPPGTNVSTTANRTFHAFAGADRAEVNLTVTSVGLGTAQIELRVVDANGTVLANETVSVPPGSNMTVGMVGDIEKPGAHGLVMRAVEGGARITGEIVVRYDEDMTSA